MVELRGRVVEVYHVKIGPHPTSSPLTHTDVHLSPWLVYLDKNWSNAEGRDEEGGRGEEKKGEGRNTEKEIKERERRRKGRRKKKEKGRENREHV